MKDQITTDSSRESKTAKNEGSNIEQILLPSTIQTQYRGYVVVRVKRDKKDKKIVRPIVYAYGTDPKEVCKAAWEAFERVQNELIQKGYTVAPLDSKSEKGGMLQK